MRVEDLPKCIKISHSIEPLWADDTGRESNSGTYSGTFIGWFDKLEINIGSTTESEMKQIRDAIEWPTLDAEFYDTKLNRFVTKEFYGTAISAECKEGKYPGSDDIRYEPFSFKLTAVRARE